MELINHVPELLARRKMSVRQFVGLCMLAGVGEKTAYRVAKGDTNVSIDTIVGAAQALGLSSISEVIDIAPEPGEQ